MTGEKPTTLHFSQRKNTKAGGGTLGGERSNGGEEEGVVGGNMVGGNPVEVTPIKEASLFSRGREDQT